MTEPTRRLAKPAFAGQTWERKRIRRLVLGHLAERMPALTRFVACGAHVTIMPDECRRDVTAFIGSLALWIGCFGERWSKEYWADRWPR